MDVRLLKVGAGEHRLGVVKALLLGLARGLAHVKVLEDEVALGVQIEEELLDVLQRRLLAHLLLLGGFDLRVELRLGGLLGRDGLHVLRARCLGVAHQALVVLLRGLFLVLRGRDAVLKLLDEHLHEGDHAVALAVLLLVRVPRGRRSRRRSLVGGHTHLSVDLRLDHLRRQRGDHVTRARRDEQLLLLCELLLRRLLVHVRAVELEELVLRLLDQLHGGVVLGLEGDEVLVLLLALLRGLRDGLVERLDLLREARDLRRERPALLRHLLDSRRARRDALLRVGLLPFSLLNLRGAERLRILVLLLLRREDLHHPVDLLHDLGEVDLLCLELSLEERQRGGVGRHLARRSEKRARPRSARRRRRALEEDRRSLAEGESLLEQVKSVVVVQDFDGFANRGNLLRADRLALSPLLLLQRALRGQVGHECLGLLHLGRRVLDVVGGRRDGNREFSAADRLRLDRLRSRGDLLLLRRRQLLEALRRFLLGRHRALQIAGHLSSALPSPLLFSPLLSFSLLCSPLPSPLLPP